METELSRHCIQSQLQPIKYQALTESGVQPGTITSKVHMHSNLAVTLTKRITKLRLT